jgi:hypothetical protein
MSYLHCPTCKRAFNLATSMSCPYCPVAATAVDAAEDIVVAAEQLARAMGRASEAERTAAADRMARLALPAPGATTSATAVSERVLRSIRASIAPPIADPSRHVPPPMFASIAMAMITRLSSRPRLAAGVRRALDAAHSVRARVRALAA